VTDSRIRREYPFKWFSGRENTLVFVTLEDVNRNIAILQKLKLEIVALSPHDSCDAASTPSGRHFIVFREIKVANWSLETLETSRTEIGDADSHVTL
jgi:hypothetical protein